MKTVAAKTTATKKVIIAVAVVLGSLSPALASSHYEFTWHDNIRPNGKPRSDAVFNGILNSCYQQTGLAREANVTQAFKGCMGNGGYTFVSTKDVPDPPSKSAPPAKLAKNQFIDPDTGLLCTNGGWADFCETPPDNMTIHYTDKHGLNCTRTGGVAICSTF
jgi:hypothetical protein